MNYKLGMRSQLRLRGVHPSLVSVVNLAIRYTAIDFGVHEGIRTAQRQRQYVEHGVSWTLTGKHMIQADGFGHAVDLVPYISGSLRWEWPAIYPVAAAVRKAASELSVPIIWGGTWSLLNALPQTPNELEDCVSEYVESRIRAGYRANIDGPHYELAT